MPASRPSWDEVWSRVATDIARRSLCVRDQVAAVIVDRGNRIVATGYNGPPAGFKHDNQPCREWCPRAKEPTYLPLDRDYGDCVALHAEANALMVCDRSVRLGGTMYVASPSCYSCAKLIANSGLDAVVIAGDSSRAPHREPEKSIGFLEHCGLDVIVVDR